MKIIHFTFILFPVILCLLSASCAESYEETTVEYYDMLDPQSMTVR